MSTKKVKKKEKKIFISYDTYGDNDRRTYMYVTESSLVHYVGNKDLRIHEIDKGKKIEVTAVVKVIK